MKAPQIAISLILLAFATAAQRSLDRVDSLAGAWECAVTTFTTAAHQGAHLQARQALGYMERVALVSIGVSQQ